MSAPHPAASLGQDAQAVWRFRQLLWSLTVRNLKVKYQRSLLGFVWTLLNPLLVVGVLVVVFTHLVRIQVPHYPAFLLSGYFAWNFLLQAMSLGTYVFSEHAQLARSVAFPKEIPVLAAVASKLAEFILELALVMLALAVWHHHGVPAAFLCVPWLLLVQLVLALGLVFPIAALSVFYQDIQHALPILLTVLFYLSPVFYPAQMVPEGLRAVYLANPVAQLLTAYHTVLYDGAAPALQPALLLTGSALVTFWVGHAIFNAYKAAVAEVV